MARRLGKRKRPLREKHMLKEQRKVDTGIFDDQTMVYLSKFFNKGMIEELKFPIAKGKESDVYLATAGSADAVKGKRYVILKFFRVETSSFYNMADYIIGDTRFNRISKSKAEIVKIWCKKEFGNLHMARSQRVSAPEPYMFNGTILAMEFIGDEEGTPAEQLRKIYLDNAEQVLDQILEQVKRLYKAGLVHADLSEYNILIKDGKPFIIDMGQSVVLKHPNAMMFLERDVGNILHYFAHKYMIERDFADAMERITAQK
ncbi:MAG: hypothetical protein KGH60_02865 [Candidatus Micrarchaeota archaeon]|nr:hypothetical protein [Candidatus Micrarchaeota archaeon]